MKKINVIIINGFPRSGKDTAIGLMKKYCDGNECAYLRQYSSIDPVKEVLRQLGWDGNKTEESRCMLAQLKQFWVSNNNGPTKYCIDQIIKAIADKSITDDQVLVFQIREPIEIVKLVDAIGSIMRCIYRINIHTLFIDRKDVEQYDNDADKNVMNYSYDFYIENNGKEISDLANSINRYMENIIFKEDKQ